MRYIFIFITAFFIAADAWAVGVDSQKMGLRNYGTGGFVGVANDASAIAFNPAGMTNIREGAVEYEVSSTFVILNVLYTTPDGGQYYSQTFPVIPTAFIAVSRGWYALGLGIYAPTGMGGIDFSNVPMTQLGNAIASTKGYQAGAAIAPSFGVKVLPWLSAGVTAEIFHTLATAELSIPSVNASAEMEADKTGAGYDLKIGVFMNLSDSVNMGLQIKTPAVIKTDGKIRENAGSLAGREFEYHDVQKVPWYFIIGGEYKATSSLSFNSDIGYRLWSRYSKDAETDDPGAGSSFALDTEPGTWKDTYTISLGITYAASPVLTLRTGFQWQPTALRRDDATFVSTDKSSLTWSMGPEIRFCEGFCLHVIAKHTWGLERTLNNGGRGSNDSWDVMIGFTGRR